MTGERFPNDGRKTITLRVKNWQLEAFEEVARREDFETTGGLVRVALGYFLVLYAEANPNFEGFLPDSELMALLGETAINGLELLPKPEDPTSQG